MAPSIKSIGLRTQLRRRREPWTNPACLLNFPDVEIEESHGEHVMGEEGNFKTLGRELIGFVRDEKALLEVTSPFV